MERQISVWYANGRVETVFSSDELQASISDKNDQDYLLCFPWMLDEESTLNLESALNYLTSRTTLVPEIWGPQSEDDSLTSSEAPLSRKEKKKLRKSKEQGRNLQHSFSSR